MKKRTQVICTLVAILFSGSAIAGPASDALGSCMIDFLNGKERKELGKWVFFGMSAHPEIADFSKISDSDRDESDKYIGYLITRLLTEDCPEKARVAIKNESSVALASAFELVGKVAMQELMTENDVNVALTGFEKYLDTAKLEALQSE